MNTGASTRGDHLGCFFDGLRAIQGSRFSSNAAPSAVDRCAGFTERACYTATGTTCRARNYCNFASQWRALVLFFVSS
jgi:hypothetical protein